MDEIRKLIQSRLDEIENLSSGPPVPDNIVEDGITYFGFELQESYVGSDFDKNYTMQPSINGRVVRKENTEENTLEIVDIAVKEIKKVLKDLNFKYSSRDISVENGIRKNLITGFTMYNEINNKFII